MGETCLIHANAGFMPRFLRSQEEPLVGGSAQVTIIHHSWLSARANTLKITPHTFRQDL